MHIYWITTLLLSLIGLGRGQNMKLWPGTGGNRASVYYAQELVSDTDADKFSGNGFQDLYQIAESHFKELKDVPNINSGTGNFLTASLWDPTGKIVYTSTIPRGQFRNYMKREGLERTPVWYSRAKEIKNSLGVLKSDYHVEDGAYFGMEYLTQRYNFLADKPDVAQTTTYAPGTKVVVWGFYTRDADSVKESGRRIALCDGTKTTQPRFPACIKMRSIWE